MSSDKIWSLSELRAIDGNVELFRDEVPGSLKGRLEAQRRNIVVRFLKSVATNVVERQEKEVGASAWQSTWFLPDRSGILRPISADQAAQINLGS